MNENNQPKCAESARPVDAPFLWTVLKRYALMICVVALLGGGLAGVLRFVCGSPIYTAETSFLVQTVKGIPNPDTEELHVITNFGDVDGATRIASTASALFLEDYALERVLSALAEQGRDDTKTHIKGLLTVTSEGQIIAVKVSAEDRDMVLAVARAVEQAFPDVVDRYFGMDPSVLGDQTGACAVALTNVAEQNGESAISQSSRNLPVFVCLGTFAAGALAYLMAMILACYDPRVRDTEELKRIAELQIVGCIPQSTPLHQTPSPATVIAYEELRTVLLHRQEGKKMFAVTSDAADVPSSAVALNLALSFANLGKRVLLMDGHLRREPSSGEVSPSVQGGNLGQILRRSAEDKRALCLPSGIHENLSVIQSGGVHPAPAELLMSAAMGGLLNYVRAQYDIVILDMPSLGECGDAVILADQVDGYILTVGEGVSQSVGVRSALEKLDLCHATTVGLIWLTNSAKP